MDAFLTIAPLIVALIGIIYFAQKKIKAFGLVYVIAYYFKWFLGIIVTMGAFYIIMITGDYLKEIGYSVVFSLPVGVVAWFVPMHYISLFFTKIEKKHMKVSRE